MAGDVVPYYTITALLYPALGTNVASSCGYIGPQNGAYVEIQYKDTTPKPLPK